MQYLTVDDVERLHLQIIDASGGSHGIRDHGRIQSAVASQKQAVFGQELFKTVFDKAAAMARGIIADHPFVDGNKRTGMMSALLFLEYNKVDMNAVDDKSLEDFAVKVATKKLSVEQISRWLEDHSKKEGDA